jgi:hypothetical protein
MDGADMTFAYTQDLPIDAATYGIISEGIGFEPPEGLIVHLAVALPGGGLRYIDVWETEDDCERFIEERVHPVVHPLLESVFGEVPPEPPRTGIEVIHAWVPGAA